MRVRRSTSLTALAASALAGVLAGALVVVPGSAATGSAPKSPAARAAKLGTLSVSRSKFVGGQSLTWTGKLPHRGVRTITMQRFLNRPGDSWIDVQDFQAETNKDGSFSFRYPAPDMVGIGYRVKSGKYATKKLDLYPSPQDVVLWTDGAPVSGEPFTIVADTAPGSGIPVISGRTLTLQRRANATSWQTLGTTTVDRTGRGRFSVPAQSAGTQVFRVREEDWTKHHNRIGWFPSFPTYVDIGAPADRQAATRTATTRRTSGGSAATSARGRSTAALRWSWGYPIFDFDWTSGESLTSKPWRGSRPQGTWQEYLGGTGRVAKRSGQLGVWSGRTDRYGSGNRGTTATTLTGNAQSYGRWELKLRTATRSTNARTWLVRAELVPEQAEDYDCGAHNITLAEIRQGSSKALIAAGKGRRQWTRTVKIGNLDRTTPAVGLELMKDHVTWFVNSSPVGVVEKRKITGGVPMTLRLSLIGDGNREMGNTTLLSDWQRGFPINRSPGVLKAPALKASKRTPPTCAD